MNTSNSDQDIMQLVEIMLLRAGTELLNDPTKTNYLRDIESQLQDFAVSSTDKRLTFLLFFITLLITDIHYNLVGDIIGVDIKELEKVRHSLFSLLGNSLITIAENLQKGDLDANSSVYMDLVYMYLKNINELNSNKLYEV